MLLSKLVPLVRHATLVTNIVSPVTKVHLNYTDAEIVDTIKLVSPALDPSIDLSITDPELPDSMAYLTVLLVKKEMYYRMACGDARLYPLGAEGASLRKDYIFEHYMSLIRAIKNDYTELYKQWKFNKGIKVSNLRRMKYHLGYDVKMDSVPPVMKLVVDSSVTDLKVTWDKFEQSDGYFWKYRFIVHDSVIYDKHTEEVVENPQHDILIYDVTRIHDVVKGLAAGVYHVALVTYLTNGVKGVTETTVTMT